MRLEDFLVLGGEWGLQDSCKRGAKCTGRGNYGDTEGRLGREHSLQAARATSIAVAARGGGSGRDLTLGKAGVLALGGT